MEEPGSEKWLKQRNLPEKELTRLWETINDDPDIDLLDWWIRGQPAPDAISGVARVRRGTSVR